MSPQTRVRGGITREPGRGPTTSPTWASAAGADVPGQVLWRAGHRSHFVLRLRFPPAPCLQLFLRTVTFTALLCHCPPPGAFPTPLRRPRDVAAAAAVTGRLTLGAPGRLPLAAGPGGLWFSPLDWEPRERQGEGQRAAPSSPPTQRRLVRTGSRACATRE